MSPPKAIHGDGIAVLFGDWTLSAKAPDGSAVDLAVQTVDVVRRQPDGGLALRDRLPVRRGRHRLNLRCRTRV